MRPGMVLAYRVHVACTSGHSFKVWAKTYSGDEQKDELAWDEAESTQDIACKRTRVRERTVTTPFNIKLGMSNQLFVCQHA